MGWAAVIGCIIGSFAEIVLGLYRILTMNEEDYRTLLNALDNARDEIRRK